MTEIFALICIEPRRIKKLMIAKTVRCVDGRNGRGGGPGPAPSPSASQRAPAEIQLQDVHAGWYSYYGHSLLYVQEVVIRFI